MSGRMKNFGKEVSSGLTRVADRKTWKRPSRMVATCTQRATVSRLLWVSLKHLSSIIFSPQQLLRRTRGRCGAAWARPPAPPLERTCPCKISHDLYACQESVSTYEEQSSYFIFHRLCRCQRRQKHPFILMFFCIFNCYCFCMMPSMDFLWSCPFPVCCWYLQMDYDRDTLNAARNTVTALECSSMHRYMFASACIRAWTMSDIYI